MGSVNSAIKFVCINKNFPGVKALENINFEVQKGEIHAIVGENGAGKSTLMNILKGAYHPDQGEIYIHGGRYIPADPMHAQKAGIAMIHQELSVVTNLTAAENIFLGRYPKNKYGFIDKKHMYALSKKILEELGQDIDPKEKVAHLSISKRQMLEIAKALSLNASIIIMDEPTSSLTMKETDILLNTMISLSNKGVTIVFISHRLEEVFKVSHKITVLRDGKYITTVGTEDFELNKIVSYMVGRDLRNVSYIDRGNQYNEELLRVENLCLKDKLTNINFKLYKGEILGFSGLVGSGRTELVQGLFGIDKVDSGEVFIKGKKVLINNPKDAIYNSMGIVTEDRKQLGLLMGMSVKDNITISKLPKNLGFFINKKQEKLIAEDYKAKLGIKTPSIKALIKNLSGGNQQKAIIARWLSLAPDILILDEPTRGIDVGAKVEIYNLIRELADNDVGIILVSSELSEILKVSDRVAVMANGTITGFLDREEMTQEKIMIYATKQIKNEVV